MKSHEITNPRNHPTSYRHKLNATLTACALAVALAMVAPGPALAQTYSVIHEFAGGPLGANPAAGMVMDRAGNLYGTTFAGGAGTCGAILGAPGCGTVFSFNPSTERLTVLYRFTGGTDGAAPQAPLLIAPDGTLYGSTTSGGVASCVGYEGLPGCGVVFHLQPRPTPPPNATANPWLETPLYSFQGPDGNSPFGDLAIDESGDIYGSTFVGGTQGVGVVFELTQSNGNWSESILHSFLLGASDGYSPMGGVTLKRGNIYGTTMGGGTDLNGTVYQLVSGSSGWTENLLYQFTGGSDGANPSSGVTFDPDGNLYSSTLFGGSGGSGTVFELSSGSWAFQLLYSFTGFEGPVLSDLIFDQAGNIYGTTYNGGAYNWGSVFKLTPSANGYTYTSLYDFCAGGPPCPDGALPIGTLVMDSAGNLYGTTTLGGSNSGICTGGYCGVMFKITP
ncbi:MAG TPA: choice-of-anchor tandem repeat GloVer-containing protein [Terriglobales bacterium]|nr:choice-of-anchor tandem repeat GloVer-containing protein [Terriglobales bacterium]